MKVGIILNTTAGKKRLTRIWRMRLPKLFPDQENVIVTDHPDQVPSAVGQLIDGKCEPIAICGGDGTMQVVLSELIRSFMDHGIPLPRIIPLKGGTINTLTKGLGVCDKPDSHLRHIMHREGENGDVIRRHRILRVNDRYAFFFALGLPARIIDLYNRSGHYGQAAVFRMVGRTAYYVLTNREQEIFKPIQARMWVDGEKVPFEQHSVSLACTIARTGFGLMPGYRVGEKEGTFHFWTTPCSVRSLAAQYPKFYFGRPLKADPLYDSLAQSVHIEFTEPTNYCLDGEIYPCEKELSIEWGPEIEFIIQ